MDEFNDDLGKSAPDKEHMINTGHPLPNANNKKADIIAIRPEIIEKYNQKIVQIQEECLTKREFQERKTDTLGECVYIASEIFKSHPMPDFAYQLAALTNAHNTSLAQLERMKDPQKELEEVESLIKKMFEDLVKVLLLEIEKSKKDLSSRFPTEKSTVDEHFGRMAKAISPESNKLYAGLQKELKKVLGIKK